MSVFGFSGNFTRKYPYCLRSAPLNIRNCTIRLKCYDLKTSSRGCECQTMSDNAYNSKHQVDPVSVGTPTDSSYQAEIRVKERDKNRSFSLG